MPVMTRVAAIDCGTNSVRLLVADIDPASGRTVELARRMEIVRLGEGVDVHHEFAPEALARTFAAVDDYAAVVAGLGAERIRFAATSASRDARNRDAFLTGVRERLGVTPEVISGDEEAALSFLGATRAVGAGRAAPFLVVDVGGGSTEFALGDEHGVTADRSADIGSVRLTERHLRSDPPTADEIARATADIDRALDWVAEAVDLTRVATLVGVSGTVTTVTAAALGLDRYDPDRLDGAELPLAASRRAAAGLLAAGPARLKTLGYMHPGRADVMGAGALIWTRVLDRVGSATAGRVATAVTSEHDILDGLAWRLAQ